MSNILCVEDDATMADHIAQGLREAGYLVDIAGTGTLGLELAMAGHYAAIVLDRMLPELDGLTVLSRLREAGNRTPVVVLSADATVESLREAEGAGALLEEYAPDVEILVKKPSNTLTA